jgi:holo-[acyl-carrier protein] synthase
VPIVGVGLDVVPVERFALALRRTPAMLTRLFTAAERATEHGEPREPESLAARFAAKEALVKALGTPGVGAWTDIEILADGHGRPLLTVAGPVAAHAAQLGIAHWHVSLSHDGGIASAVVIAES